VQCYGVLFRYLKAYFWCQCARLNNIDCKLSPSTVRTEFHISTLQPMMFSPLLLIASIFGSLFLYVSTWLVMANLN
jgi:hypothetical protein